MSTARIYIDASFPGARQIADALSTLEDMMPTHMSGEEHFAEAERLLTEAAGTEVDAGDPTVWPTLLRAQTHAMLAHVSAVATGSGRILRGGIGSWRNPTPPAPEYTGEPTPEQAAQARREAMGG